MHIINPPAICPSFLCTFKVLYVVLNKIQTKTVTKRRNLTCYNSCKLIMTKWTRPVMIQYVFIFNKITKTLFLQISGHVALIFSKCSMTLHKLHDIHLSLTKASAPTPILFKYWIAFWRQLWSYNCLEKNDIFLHIRNVKYVKIWNYNTKKMHKNHNTCVCNIHVVLTCSISSFCAIEFINWFHTDEDGYFHG